MRATLAVIALALAAAACSKPQTDQTRHDLSDTGKDLSGVAREAARSPQWAKTRADLRRLGHDIGAEAKLEAQKGADETRTQAHNLASDARHTTHEAHKHADNAG